MFGLEGKSIVLTGAAGHLGAPIAAALAREGARLTLVGRSAEKLDRLRASLEGAQCETFAVDLADRERLQRFIEAGQGRPIHGLVNNAYSGKAGAVHLVQAADFDQASAANLVAPFLLSKGLAAELKAGAEESGTASSIVNIASMYGKVSPHPEIYARVEDVNPVHYGATKAGLIQITRYLACSLDPAHIRVNSVSPGPFPRAADTAFEKALADRLPMKRIGRPEEIVGPVLFLLSSHSSYVNGADLAVDGGWTAW
jgi:NAD(P)-dependent dehydrogenase (short-subunit alcohol dehydrogenase family)